MPQIQNVEVLSIGTTTKTWTAMAPSSGDQTPAIWRITQGFTSPKVMPTAKYLARANGQKTARRHEIQIVYPYSYTNAATGLIESKDSIRATMSVVIPDAMPIAFVETAVNETTFLFSSWLIRESMKTGFSPS